MTLKGQGRNSNVFWPNISKTAGDRDMVRMEHLYEMACGKSNGHVIDDVR